MNPKTYLSLFTLSVSCAIAAPEKPMLPSGWRMHDMERPQPAKVSQVISDIKQTAAKDFSYELVPSGKTNKK